MEEEMHGVGSYIVYCVNAQLIQTYFMKLCRCANSCLFNWVINLIIHRMATAVVLASKATWIVDARRVFIACIGINLLVYIRSSISYRSMYQCICIL